MTRLTLLLALALLPAAAAAADLKIDKVKARYGELGPERAALDVPPGDEVHFTFNVSGLKTDEAGKVGVEFRQVVTAEGGEVLLDKSATNEQVMAFGGDSLPSFAAFSFGKATPPGKYTLKVTVTDKLGKGSASFERAVTCVKPAFALVRRELHHDAERKAPAGTTAALGARVYYRFLATEYDRSKQKLDLQMTVQVYDDKRQPQMPKPVVVSAATDDAAAVAKTEQVTFTGFLTANRVGTFTVRIAVTDNLTKQTVTWEFPLTVVE